MNGTKTLSQVCSTLKVSRRAVQGYENAGLLVPTGKNKYGHLLYNAEAQLRIERIKMFQRLGFTIGEIKEIIDAPDEILKTAVKEQICKVKKEIMEKKKAIIVAEKFLNLHKSVK